MPGFPCCVLLEPKLGLEDVFSYHAPKVFSMKPVRSPTTQSKSSFNNSFLVSLSSSIHRSRRDDVPLNGYFLPAFLCVSVLSNQLTTHIFEAKPIQGGSSIRLRLRRVKIRDASDTSDKPSDFIAIGRRWLCILVYEWESETPSSGPG